MKDEDYALMIPYDKKLEFPFEKLDFGSQIGAGQYGRVFRAQVNIISGAYFTLNIR